MVTGRSRACGSVRLSVATVPKSSAPGDSATLGRPTVPVAATATLGVLGSSVEIVNVPVRGPGEVALCGGANVTSTVRLPPGASTPLVGDVGLMLYAGSPLNVTLFTPRSAVPVFCTTTLRDTAEPRGTVPKFSDPLTVTWGSPTLAAAVIVF